MILIIFSWIFLFASFQFKKKATLPNHQQSGFAIKKLMKSQLYKIATPKSIIKKQQQQIDESDLN